MRFPKIQIDGCMFVLPIDSAMYVSGKKTSSHRICKLHFENTFLSFCTLLIFLRNVHLPHHDARKWTSRSSLYFCSQKYEYLAQNREEAYPTVHFVKCRIDDGKNFSHFHLPKLYETYSICSYLLILMMNESITLRKKHISPAPRPLHSPGIPE